MSTYDPAFVEVQELVRDAEKDGLPETIKDRLEKIEQLMVTRDAYCLDHTTPCSREVEALTKTTYEHPWEKLYQEGKIKFNMRTSMLSGGVTGSFLQFLVRSSGAKAILEIGTFTGCSALMMAEVIDPDVKVVTCDFDPYVVDLAKQLTGKSQHSSKIDFRLGPAKDTLQQLSKEGQKFDFIFIDADKKRYVDYLTICLDSLLAHGGSIVVDNAMFYGTAYAEKPRETYGDHTRKFNEAVKQRTDIFHVLLPVRDGIMLMQKKKDRSN